MDIDMRMNNSKALRYDVAYNLIHESYLIYDAITLLKLAAEHLDADINAGVCGAHTKAQRAELEKAINRLNRYQYGGG